jgi:uncharacterized protein
VKRFDLIALILVIIGALNWGLVAIARFDLVAWIFGQDFGGTTAASRVVYGLVGVAGIYCVASLIAGRSALASAPRQPRPERG